MAALKSRMSSKTKQGSNTKDFAAVQGNFKEFAKIVSKISSVGADLIRELILCQIDKYEKIKTTSSTVNNCSRHYFVNRLEKYAWSIKP